MLHVWQSTIVDSFGNVIPAAQIEVKLVSSGALAPIYSDVGGASALLNPFAADADGFARFFASNNRYRIRAYNGSQERVWEHAELGVVYDQSSTENTQVINPSNLKYAPPEERITGNVRRWGCVCDGVTDDTAAFQNAINSIPAKGGNLYVPGDMKLTASILIENKRGLVLEIANGAVIKFTDGSYVGLRFKGGQQNVIRGGAIFGTSNGAEAITLVRVGETSFPCPLFLMEGCTLAFAAICIHVANSYETVLRGNNYSNAFNFVTYGGLGSMAANFFTNETYGFMNRGNATNYGVITKAPGLHMASCNWENIGHEQNALNIQTGTQGLQITGCSLENSGGILIAPSTGAQFSTTRFHNSWDSTNNRCIRLDGGAILKMTNCHFVQDVLIASVIGIVASTSTLVLSTCSFNKWATGLFSGAGGSVNNCAFLNCTLGAQVNTTAIGSGGAGPCVIDNNVFISNTTGITVGGQAKLIKNGYDNNGTNITKLGSGEYIDEAVKGATAAVADGGTITHGHAKTPASVRAVGSVAGEFVSVTAIAAANFTVAIKKHDNTAGTAQTIYWEAAG